MPLRGRIDPGRVTDLLRELATLLAVGVPLDEALGVAAAGHAGRLRTVLLDVRDRVAAGSPLAAAMGRHPGAFDELCLRVVGVGEQSGTLDAALLRLGVHRERGRQLRGKLLTAVLYPLIVVVTAVAVSIFLMTFVVPNILRPLEEMGRPLPLPTRLVKGASDLLVGWGWLMAVTGVAALALGSWAYRTRRGRRAWLTLALFDQVCPPDAAGTRRVRESAWYLPALRDSQRHYRHVLFGAWSAHHLHRADPAAARILLCGPLHVMGHFQYQLASRREVLSSGPILACAAQLYLHGSPPRARRGSVSRGVRGSVFRFVRVMNEFDRGWDTAQVPPERLLAMLPAEFDDFTGRMRAEGP